MADKSKIYAIVNAEPEIQAYGLARFSRSADSCGEAMLSLTSEDASKFFDKYFGHKSIADLGHLAIAVEDVSQWVADELELPWDGPWDGQERSTRYQDFSKRKIYWPEIFKTSDVDLFQEIINRLFDLYDKISEEHPLDVARYCLPMGTLTSVGQVVSIRTLEKQICRMLASEFAEVRAAAEKLKKMCHQPAFNVLREKLLRTEKADLLPSRIPEQVRKNFKCCNELIMELMVEGMLEHILPEVKPAPTLARYLSENEYLSATREILRNKARWYLPALTPKIGINRTRVDCCYRFSTLAPYEQVIVMALYWQGSGHQIGEVVRIVEGLNPCAKEEIFRVCHAFRREHDEALSLFRTGCCAVEYVLDNGADRDMKRHRRCVQIPQRPTTKLGFAVPQPLEGDGLENEYVKVMADVQQKVRRLEKEAGWEVAMYTLPFAQVRPRLFLFDLAEVDYVARLRTKPGGHFEYRQRAFDMYERFVDHDERLAGFLDATNPNEDSEK